MPYRLALRAGKMDSPVFVHPRNQVQIGKGRFFVPQAQGLDMSKHRPHPPRREAQASVRNEMADALTAKGGLPLTWVKVAAALPLRPQLRWRGV